MSHGSVDSNPEDWALQRANPAAMTGQDVAAAQRTGLQRTGRQRAGRRPGSASPAGAVIVMHGGRSVSAEPTTAVQPSVLRMIPVAAAIRHALRGTGAVVCRPRFRVRGWNGPEASPVQDLNELLDELSGRFDRIPVVLVGHSRARGPRCAPPRIRS